MEALLTFDIEDIFVPAEGGMDDFLKELADILSSEHVTGTFNLIGDKLRLLKQRGRTDVLKALAAHEIGHHTDKGTRHPTVFEYLENKGWRDGVRECDRREKAYFAELQATFKKPTPHLASHIATDAAQLVHWLGRQNKAFLFSIFHLPEFPRHTMNWYCGALNICGYIGGIEANLTADTSFPKFLADLDRRLTADKQDGQDVTCLFACHDMMKAGNYTDRFWSANGVNLPRRDWGRWGHPVLKSAREMANVGRNFRSLAQFLRAHPALEMTTVAQLQRRYAHQRGTIAKAELAALAEKIVHTRSIVIGEHFSAGEIILALADSIVTYAARSALPAQVKIRATLGPATRYLCWPEMRQCDYADVVRVSRELLAVHLRSGTLSAEFTLRGLRLGLNSCYYLLAQAYLALSSGRPPASYPLYAEIARYPAAASVIGNRLLACGDCLLYKPDLDMSKIITHVKLQTWTLKPAHKGLGRD